MTNDTILKRLNDMQALCDAALVVAALKSGPVADDVATAYDLWLTDLAHFVDSDAPRLIAALRKAYELFAVWDAIASENTSPKAAELVATLRQCFEELVATELGVSDE